jgi:hypothetical protein
MATESKTRVIIPAGPVLRPERQISYSILLYSSGMCRMRRFLPVLRHFFHSSLLRIFMPPFSINYSSTLLTSSCHLFRDLPLKLLVPKFIYNTYKIFMPGEMLILQLCYVDGNLSVCTYLYNMTW